MAVHLAVQSGNFQEVSSLLDAGADVNESDTEGYTPLHKAAECGNEALVEFLIEKGAHVGAADGHQHLHPIHLAAGRLHPIHLAAGNGHLRVVDILVKYGADIYSKSEYTFYPIHFAAEGGYISVIDYFLNNGVDVDIPSFRKYTPLIRAAFCGQLKTVEFLLGNNADIDYKDEYRFTPLHYACLKGHTEVVKYLIEEGAKFDEGCVKGWTALHVSAESGHREAVELLLAKGARYGFTRKKFGFLIRTAEAGETEIIKYFLNKGVSVNFRTSDGYSLLHAAARSGEKPLVQFLIGNGALVDAKTQRKGLTALHLAVSQCELDVMDVLIEHGADFEARDKKGRTPLDLVPRQYSEYFTESHRCEQKECAKILIKYSLLRHRNRDGIPIDDFYSQKELVDFSRDCLEELDEMKSCLIKNTTVTLYKVIQNIFNETKLSTYMCNEVLRRELQNPQLCFQRWRIYGKTTRLIERKIEQAVTRQNLVRKAALVMENIVPTLPIKMRWEIISYLSDTELQNFIKSLELS